MRNTILSARYLWVSVLLMACGHDATAPAASRSFYWQLQLNHHAVTLATVAPYDTIHLVATALDQTGAPLPVVARPTYTLSDTSITIDSAGLVRVHWTGSDAPPVTVIATFSVGAAHVQTLADTVVFNIVNWNSASEVPMLDSLIFRPVAGDSARRAVIDTGNVPGMQTFDAVVAKTANGAIISNVLVRYKTSDSLIANIASPVSATSAQINAFQPGVVLLTAEATVYGRRKVDSLWYTVGYPLRILWTYGVGQLYQLKSIPIPDNYVALGQLTVGQGGAILWGNTTQGKPNNSLDIQFDDTTGIVGLSESTAFSGMLGPIMILAGTRGGNIPAFPAAPIVEIPFGTETLNRVGLDSTTSKARTFTQPRIYHWSSVLQGITGTVTVVSNDSLLQHHTSTGFTR